MRKLNVSMDMFGNTKGKEIENVTMKYLSLSWQASICLAYLPTCFLYSFFLSFVFFVLEQVFIHWHNGMKILWVEQGISSLTHWHDDPIYSRCYIGISYEVGLKKKLRVSIIWKLP